MLIVGVIGPIGAVAVVAARTLVAASVLAIVCKVKKVPSLGVELRHILVFGVTSGSITYIFLTLSTQLTDAGTAAVVNSTMPMFTLVIAVALGLARASRKGWLGLAICIVGVAIVAQQRAAHLSLGFVVGIFSGLLGTASYAYSAVYAGRHFAGEPVLRVALSQQLVSFITVLPLLLIFPPRSMPSLGQGAYLLALGIVSTALAQVLFFLLISQIGAVRSSYVNYLVPMFGVLWGWMFLGEPVSPASYLGIAAVIAGLWMLLTPKKELGTPGIKVS